MSGRSKAGVSAARWRAVWIGHEKGLPARAIARELRIDEKAVQHYLAKGRPAELTRNKPAELPPCSSAARARVSSADSSAAGTVLPLPRRNVTGQEASP